jgi:hypothetical protein
MDLQSIYPATKTVPFLGGKVYVKGLTLRAAAQLTIEFPVLLALASGKADLAGLVVSGPDAALAIVAQGLQGASDNKALLEAFDRAAFGEQIDLLGEIIDLTFKGERAGPFLESLAARASPPRSAPAADSAKTSPQPLAT